MHCCRLWSLSAPLLPPPPPAPLLPPPPPPLQPCPPPPPSLAHTALWLPSLGNCLRILPACSVIGRWHSGVPLPDPASCADYCLLMFQRSSRPSTPLIHTSSLLPLLGNTCRHLCLSGISLARVGRPRPAALVFVGSEGRRAVWRTDGTNYWIS